MSACGSRMALALLAIALGMTSIAPGIAADSTAYATVTLDNPAEYPRDSGSHPDFRTEWWYVTGWLSTNSGESLGFQVTFFRTRPAIDAGNPSAFAPRQLLIAHCALSDPQRGRLWQDQKIRRAGFGLARAAVGDTDVMIDQWTLKRAGGVYTARIAAEDFALSLDLGVTQPPLLNGPGGVSRKGASPQAASYYYSLPHLSVSGSITRGGRHDAVQGEAWLDPEWSSENLESGALGWDWIGINFGDGGALLAFQNSGARNEPRWAGGTLRDAAGTVHLLAPDELRFEPKRIWTSPRTGTAYPVEWHVRAGARELDLQPLIDDQENDTRLSTGAVYWEGAVRAYEAHHPVGRGYLELTGYAEPLRLR